jgi:hypothetical protein
VFADIGGLPERRKCIKKEPKSTTKEEIRAEVLKYAKVYFGFVLEGDIQIPPNVTDKKERKYLYTIKWIEALKKAIGDFGKTNVQSPELSDKNKQDLRT